VIHQSEPNREDEEDKQHKRRVVISVPNIAGRVHLIIKADGEAEPVLESPWGRCMICVCCALLFCLVRVIEGEFAPDLAFFSGEVLLGIPLGAYVLLPFLYLLFRPSYLARYLVGRPLTIAEEQEGHLVTLLHAYALRCYRARLAFLAFLLPSPLVGIALILVHSPVANIRHGFAWFLLAVNGGLALGLLASIIHPDMFTPDTEPQEEGPTQATREAPPTSPPDVQLPSDSSSDITSFTNPTATDLIRPSPADRAPQPPSAG